LLEDIDIGWIDETYAAELRADEAEARAPEAADEADARAPEAWDEADARAPEAADEADASTPDAWLAALPVSEPKTVLKPVVVGTRDPAELVMVATRGSVVTALAPGRTEAIMEAAADAADPEALASAPVKMGMAAGTWVAEAPMAPGMIVSASSDA
jgi:hypothetical protein